jgi:nucleotide-binding universal stress UspA family protein
MWCPEVRVRQEPTAWQRDLRPGAGGHRRFGEEKVVLNASHAIVVGFDGSDASNQAVEYAASAALARSLTLHVVHCCAWSPKEGAHAEAGRRMLASLGERLRVDYPGLSVRSTLVSRSPAVTLIGESRMASMVVVAHEGSGTFGNVHVGAVSRQVASQAFCPVAVIRGTGETAGRPVVLAIDAEANEMDATAFGFAEATRSGVGLLAMYLTDRDQPRQQPDEMLALWRDKYPDVEASAELVARDSAADRLVSASNDASLLVVGSRAARTDRSMPIGSLHGPLLASAGCPVVIVNSPGVDVPAARPQAAKVA